MVVMTKGSAGESRCVILQTTDVGHKGTTVVDVAERINLMRAEGDARGRAEYAMQTAVRIKLAAGASTTRQVSAERLKT